MTLYILGNHAMGPTGRLLVDFAIVVSQTGNYATAF